MRNSKDSAKNIIDNFIKILKQDGFEISEPQIAQFSYQANITGSDGKIKLLVYFGKKGNKVVLQGNKDLNLYQELNHKIFGAQLFNNVKNSVTEPDIYIGTDESGKGDYFGPLVVASVFTDPSFSEKLRILGVRDSKELTDQAISALAPKIKKLEGCVFDLIVINPEKYNILYNKMGNLNSMLGWAHSRALENVLAVKFAHEAISDKFGNEKYIRNALQEKGKDLLLHQVIKAEKYIAVAAASILARDSFNRWFINVNKKMKLQLPKGASNIVEKKAKEIKNKYGDEVLNKLVKLHFKTTKKI